MERAARLFSWALPGITGEDARMHRCHAQPEGAMGGGTAKLRKVAQSDVRRTKGHARAIAGADEVALSSHNRRFVTCPAR
jgi:hypothetical protein